MIKRVLDDFPTVATGVARATPGGEPRPLFAPGSPPITPAAGVSPKAVASKGPAPLFDQPAQNPIVAAAWQQLDARHPQLDDATRRTARRLLEELFPVSLKKLEGFGAELLHEQAAAAQALGTLSQEWAQQGVGEAVAAWAAHADPSRQSAKPTGLLDRWRRKKDVQAPRPLALLRSELQQRQADLEPICRRLHIICKQLVERVRIVELLDTWIGSTLPPQFEQPWQHRCRLLQGGALTCKNAELLVEQLTNQTQSYLNQVEQIEQLLLPVNALSLTVGHSQK